MIRRKMAASMESNKLSDGVVKNVCEKWEITELRPHQELALVSVLKKKDCLICVPTGSGKSLCYESIAYVHRHELGSDHDWGEKSPIVLVISPLVQLIQSQVTSISKREEEAVALGSSLDRQKLQQGYYSYLFGSPENFLQDKAIWDMMKTSTYKERVVALVFDEVHTAVSWGLSAEGKPAFRKFFSEVSDIRALFPAVPMLALTATASQKTQEKVREILALKDPVVFSESPDRSNIRMCVSSVSRGPDCLNWLVEEIQESICPQTIIYCRRIRDCSEVYMHFLEALGQPEDVAERQFDMVHSKTPQAVKDRVVKDLTTEGSSLRVVIATKVIGMGIDVRCDQIVHYGPPQTTDDYLQQIGRAGRSGSQTHAVLLYNGHQLRSVEPSMLKALKSNEECFRKLVLEDFGGISKQVTPSHLCCSFCASQCQCGSCDMARNGFERFGVGEDTAADVSKFVRHIDGESQRNLKMALHELKSGLDKEILLNHAAYVRPEIIHGLTSDVITSVVENAKCIFSVDDLIELCDVMQYSTACQVVQIFSEVFGDMDLDLGSGLDLELGDYAA